MPDKRRHRGPHPDDRRLFGPAQLPGLRQAVAELSWLLTRGYAPDSALKIVGDRHTLAVRQRRAVQRSSCPDDSLQTRLAKRITTQKVAGQVLGIDGYNLLITLECALSGAIVLLGRDGCFRDLAGIHGTYRKVEETRPAVELIVDQVAGLTPQRVDWLIDRPVSNSGRLKALIADVLEARADACLEDGGDRFALADQQDSVTQHGTLWNVELVDNPDAQLISYSGVVVTGDSVILDGCDRWTNLAGEIIRHCVPEAWTVDLRPDDAEP
jgi:hypothetical protein